MPGRSAAFQLERLAGLVVHAVGLSLAPRSIAELAFPGFAAARLRILGHAPLWFLTAAAKVPATNRMARTPGMIWFMPNRMTPGALAFPETRERPAASNCEIADLGKQMLRYAELFRATRPALQAAPARCSVRFSVSGRAKVGIRFPR